MRRVLEMGEQRYGGQAQRLLVIESDSEAELLGLMSAASKKGWSLYVQGTVPESGWHSAWMMKPVEICDTAGQSI